jgi:hypothetical protein
MNSIDERLLLERRYAGLRGRIQTIVDMLLRGGPVYQEDIAGWLEDALVEIDAMELPK